MEREELSLSAVKAQWCDETTASREERLRLLNKGFAEYVVYIVKLATVRSGAGTLPTLVHGASAKADGPPLIREAFDFLVRVCKTESVPEARQYISDARATTAAIQAQLAWHERFPDDEETMKSALGLLVILLRTTKGQAQVALEGGGLRLAASVRGNGFKAKTKEVCGHVAVPQAFPGEFG